MISRVGTERGGGVLNAQSGQLWRSLKAKNNHLILNSFHLKRWSDTCLSSSF